MANIFDYLDWRDIELEKVEFNEIDNLICSRVSYFPFDDIIKEKTLTLEQAYDTYLLNGAKGRILQQEDTVLFPRLAKSKRFGKIKLSNYINKLDPKQEKQFSAITFELPDNTIYVAYRGTDDTIVGWKEDLNMSFSLQVPAQIEAVKYLEFIASKFDNQIRVGGHSKGGNLAIYAASFCNPEVQNRIIKVYNNDGPGFHENVISSNGYKNILNRTTSYIPQTSIIGRFLEHNEDTIILKSTQTGIMQHDLYTWQVLGDKFVKDTLTNSSNLIDKTVSNWVKEVSLEQKQKFIDALFEILNATQVDTLAEMGSNKLESAKVMVTAYRNLDEKSRDILFKTLNIFFKEAAYFLNNKNNQ